MRIQFRKGVEGPVRILNTAQYERTFEGEGPFDVDEGEWVHLRTVLVNVFEEQKLGSLSGGGKGKVKVSKSVPVFEPAPERPRAGGTARKAVATE